VNTLSFVSIFHSPFHHRACCPRVDIPLVTPHGYPQETYPRTPVAIQNQYSTKRGGGGKIKAHSAALLFCLHPSFLQSSSKIEDKVNCGLLYTPLLLSQRSHSCPAPIYYYIWY
jgi:hypothetical protein